MEKEKKLKPRERAHYVNNALFSAAVVEYVIACKESEEKEEPYPIVTNYIAECFSKRLTKVYLTKQTSVATLIVKR